MNKDIQLYSQNNTGQNIRANFPGDTLMAPDQGINFKLYVKIFNKYRNIILSCIAGSFIIALIYSFTATPLYTATSKIRISTYEPVLSATKIEDMLQQKSKETNYFDTQVQEISSFSLADQVLKDDRISSYVKGNASKGGFFAGLFGSTNEELDEIKKETEISAKDVTVNSDFRNFEYQSNYDELKKYLELVNVAPIRRTSLVNLQVTLPNPELAAYITNKHASEYIDWIRFKRIEQQSRGLTFLKAQSDELKEKVSDLERELADYAETNSIIALNKDENITVQKMSQLNNLLTAATARRIETENAYIKAEEAIKKDSAGVDDNSVQNMRAELIKLQAERQLLSQKFTASYPRIKQIDAQIENLDKSVKEQRQQLVTGLKVKADAAREEENNLREELEKQKSLAFELSKKQVNYNILNRELTASRELLQNIISQIKETSIAVESNSTNVTLVDPAVIPSKPSFPRKKIILALSLLIGAGIGLFLAFFLNYMDNSVRTVDDLIETTGIPALGMVPTFEKAPANFDKAKTDKTLEIGEAGTPAENSSAGEEKIDDKNLPEIVPNFIKNPKSISSEAYRTIRTALLLSQAGEPPKTILVTSAQASEGKTTTSINLAASFASTGARVIIIDSDLRRPKLYKQFGMGSEIKGVSEVLSGLVKTDEVILKDVMPNLSIMLSGAVPPNPAELLGSTKMIELINELSSKYDHVIIDSPPVLPVTDAVVLSRNVDGAVLVVRAGVTPKRVMYDALDKLKFVGARILGAVLNDVDTSRNEYYYYNRYYHSYYTEFNDKDSKAA